MTVRGTTAWQHGIAQKKVINHDRGGTYVMCAWLDCEKPGYELYKVRVRTHSDKYAATDERVMNYVFCSERCKHHWLEDWRRSMRQAELAGRGRRRLYWNRRQRPARR